MVELFDLKGKICVDTYALGRSAAHSHLLTEMFTYIGVGSLLLGLALLLGNLFLGLFTDENHQTVISPRAM